MDWVEVVENPILKDLPFKIERYLAKGAHEVWVCGEDGEVRFYEHRGRVGQSRLLGARFEFERGRGKG
jgi:hypothetical protein